MKKIISLIIMLCMILSLSTCFAEAEDSAEVAVDKANVEKTGVTKSSLEEAFEAPVSKENAAKEGQTKGIATQDTVTITANDDNTISYRVVIPHGVVLNYTSGNAIALTQDLLQQADWFVNFFNDPRAVVENWIERELHFNIYDLDTSTDIYFHVFPSGLSVLCPDSRELDEADANAILEALKSNKNYFLGASEANVGWLGDNVWFLGDMRGVDGTVTLVCFVGGVEIFCYANITSDAQYDALITELGNLQISAA